MKKTRTILIIILAIFITTSCEKDPAGFDMDSLQPDLKKSLKVKPHTPSIATGSVEIAWKGGLKGGTMGNKPENLMAFFEFNAHEASAYKEAKGEIIYTVMKMDTTLHREIRAEVFDILIDTDECKAWFIGQVVSDTKGCDGGMSDGHDSGCSDTDHTDEGGCSDTDHTDEGGCSDTDHTDEGGCGDDTSHDGGCSHDETDDGGGCSGETGEEGHSTDMGPDSSGGSTKGNPLSGKNCRIGQLIVVKVHDRGTPGTAGDGLTWKWFSPEGSFIPNTDNIPEWPHLCKKTILGGNLVVH